MSILYILATISGILGGLANFPQAIKIFKRKSAKDISIITYGFFFLGTIIWILYGIEIKNFPVTITNIMAEIGISLVIVGWFLYGRGRK